MSKSETAIQTEVRLAAPRLGLRLFRNNVGVAMNPKGQPIRFGLANDSKSLNEQLKSGDLIGWRTLIITPEMVGTHVAQFVSIECKSEDWRPDPNSPREIAQRRWADLVNNDGGHALIVNNASVL